MTATSDADSSRDNSPFFRCPVQSGNSRGSIQIGFRNVPVSVQERSIDGFTVLVSPKYSRRLKVGGPWTMFYDGSEVEVHPQWFFNSPDGQVQMGLRQVKDVTKLKVKGRSLWSRVLPRKHYENSQSSTAAFGGFVLVLFCALALPGLGDKLGTANRIQSSLRWFVQGADSQIDQWMR